VDVAGGKQIEAVAIEDRLRATGLRVTGPRVTVYNLLESLGGHHSADDLVQRLAAQRSGLSRASVFNVLNDLTRCGLIMLCDAGPGRAYYEASEKWHHHFVCRRCGDIYDVPCAMGRKPCLDADLPSPGFSVDEAQVIFRGLCPHCNPEVAPGVVMA
jgi:Fe2+ or Zn2+ uptake regulation protein